MERKHKEMGRNGNKLVGKEDEGKIKLQVLSRHLSHTSFPPACSQVENYTESQKKHGRNSRANNFGSQVIRLRKTSLSWIGPSSLD